MSIKNLEKIDNTESEEYRKLVKNINSQFESLSEILNHYSINESRFYLKIAYKCFEREIAKEIEDN